MEEQVGWKGVDECLKIEKLCLGCKKGAEIKETCKTEEEEDAYLEACWEAVFASAHARKDERTTVMFVSDESAKKPLLMHLPRYNSKSMLALRRAETQAGMWRGEVSNFRRIPRCMEWGGAWL